MSFVEELKRRNVFRVGAAYAVAAWIVLQLLDVLGEIFELPAWGGKLIVLLVVLGFFLTLFFAWAFELTPEGVKRESEVDRSQSITPQTGRKLDRSIIGLLVLALGYFIWESRFMDRVAEDEAPPPAPSEAPVTTAPVMPDQDSAKTEPINLADQNSIAVLPFANRSLREEDSFFAEGIHDDLLTQLAKINNLKVVSRTSVLKYAGTDKSIPEIAEELRVAVILEGGVQRAGDRVRINVQLIDVNSDAHLWAETFDREMTVENIFDIQSEITRQVVQAVRGELSANESLRLARVPTNNLEAYEAYLQALALINRADYSMAHYREAEQWLQKVVELDPGFAQAWAMLVEVHGQAVWMGYGNPAERAARARTALQNAKRLAPEAPETVAAEAEYAYRLENDFPRARDLFDQAHRLLPGDVDILFRRGVAQRRTPQLDAALETFEQALAMDPNFGRVAVVITETLMSMGRFEEMGRRLGDFLITYPDARDLQAYRAELYMRQNQLAQARTVIDGMQPSVGSAYFWAATSLPFLERDYDKAIEVLEVPEIAAFLQTRGLIGYRELSRAYALGFMGDDDGMRREAQAAIAAIEAAPAAGTYNDAFELSTQMVAEALLGDREAALANASRAYEALNPDKDFLFGSFMAHNRCLVLAMVGDREEALAEIERWLDAPYPLQRELLRISPYWDFLREDERFNIMIGAGDASASGP